LAEQTMTAAVTGNYGTITAGSVVSK